MSSTLPGNNTSNLSGSTIPVHNSNSSGNIGTHSSVRTLSTGGDNTSTGTQALFFLTTGSNNTGDGNLALLQNTSGNGNTAVGSNALVENTIGNYNTAVGYKVLTGVTGSNNIGIGCNTDLPSTLPTGVRGDNNILIGCNCTTIGLTGTALTDAPAGTLGQLVIGSAANPIITLSATVQQAVIPTNYLVTIINGIQYRIPLLLN